MLLFFRDLTFYFIESFLNIPFENGLNSHFGVIGEKLDIKRYIH